MTDTHIPEDILNDGFPWVICPAYNGRAARVADEDGNVRYYVKKVVITRHDDVWETQGLVYESLEDAVKSFY
jgi:hypothetical protein